MRLNVLKIWASFVFLRSFGKWYLSSRNVVKNPEIIPLDAIPYDEFRDKEKLKSKVQYEATIYEDFVGGLSILTEEFPPLQPEEP